MIAVPHPVNRQIGTYSYLYALITNYQSYVDGWRDSALKEIEANAKEAADGDKEIECCIYSQESGAIYDQSAFEELVFNKSMLIMVYSYFDSIIHKMAVDVGIIKDEEERPSIICQKKSTKLSKESFEKMDLIRKVHFLRNHLCHNDSVTVDRSEEESKNALNWLHLHKCIDVIWHDDDKLTGCEVCYIDKNFVLDVLNKEHDVLMELSKVMEYKGHNC